MALQTAALNAAVDAIVALTGFASIHTADPGGTGASEVSGGGYARQAVTWTAASNGSRSANATLAFSAAASTAANFVGLWSAVTGGTWYGGEALAGDNAFNAAGDYNVTVLTITVAAA